LQKTFGFAMIKNTYGYVPLFVGTEDKKGRSL